MWPENISNSTANGPLRWLLAFPSVVSPPLLLAPNELTELRWDYLPTPCTVTRLSTTGETLGTVTGARVVLPGGWVERFKDPEAAATTLAQESSTSGVATELVHVETGTII